MAEFDLKPIDAECPYCGEPIELLVDCPGEEQRYIEDCQVCCRPMNVHVTVGQDGLPSVQVTQENEA